MSKIHGSAQIMLATITDAVISTSANIQDSKLATISTPGKVANSATSGTTANTASTLMLRDANGKHNIDQVTGTLLAANGGTGVDNGTNTLTMQGAISFLGANAVSFTTLGTTALTLPTSGKIATEEYVDATVTGLKLKAACRVATTGPITLSGLQTIDTVTVVANDRVLVKDQADPKQNGIYLAATGSWTRATDLDGTPSNEVAGGVFGFVEQGVENGGQGYVIVWNGNIVVGTDPINWTQFSGAGQITAGTGLTKNGNILSLSTIGTAGTYNSITTDATGRVISGAKYTTLAAAGLTGQLSDITDVTATAAEVNSLHGSQIVLTDLQKLHAITKTALEINDLVTLTNLGSSTGAQNVGVANISGVTGNDVQTILQNMEAQVAALQTAGTKNVPYEFVGTADGSTTQFTAASGYVAGTLKVYVNGLLVRKGTGADEVNETNAAQGKFTFGTAPLVNSEIIITYTKI